MSKTENLSPLITRTLQPTKTNTTHPPVLADDTKVFVNETTQYSSDDKRNLTSNSNTPYDHDANNVIMMQRQQTHEENINSVNGIRTIVGEKKFYQKFLKTIFSGV